MGLAWAGGPESNAGGSEATGEFSLAGRVKGDDPDLKGDPCLPGWGLGVGLNTSPLKTNQMFRNPKER